MPAVLRSILPAVFAAALLAGCYSSSDRPPPPGAAEESAALAARYRELGAAEIGRAHV